LISYLFSIRPFVKKLFEQCGVDDAFGHFYTEMESWKLWEIDLNKPRRTGIKTLAFEWLRQYVCEVVMSYIENVKIKANRKQVDIYFILELNYGSNKSAIKAFFSFYVYL
jgi:hypothetical protein